MKSYRLAIVSFTALSIALAFAGQSQAVLTYTIGGNWDSEARRTAATNAMQAVVDRYNAYGNFGNHNIYVYYSSGIPTAQASYLGSIGFGGTWPGERVALHEAAHYLGLPSNSYAAWMSDGQWDGPLGSTVVRQFDGDQATLNGDSIHFWPYGLNYDSEGSDINMQRHVAVVYAMRGDLGIGSKTHPSTATMVTMTQSDPVGQSSFNYKDQWSDGYFAHAGADYFTGDYALRTPANGNSFTFAGDSLTVNNHSSDKGLYYKGTGTTGVITFNDLRLDGGWVYHLSGNGDLFQLDGNVHVLSESNIHAAQGSINILADIHGEDTLIIYPTAGRHVVRFRSGENRFTGDLVNMSRFELSAGANFVFALGDPGVNNVITGENAQATIINGTFEFDLTNVQYAAGNSWQLVTAANVTYGPTFQLDGFHNDAGLWSNGSFTFDPASHLLTATPRGDLNSDGVTDMADWLAFRTHHLTDLSEYTAEQRAAMGDLDGDGDNDFADFRQFQFQYDALNGAGAFAAIAGITVPEPGTLLLAMLAASASIAGRRRRVL